MCPEFSDDEDPPPEYDVADRVRQLNEELAREPSPDDDDRDRAIKFKEDLVDLVVPPDDYSDDDEQEGEGRNSGQENRTDGDEQRTSSGGDDELILVERNGKYELVNARDLSAEERAMYGVSGGSNTSSPRSPTSDGRPSTANGDIRNHSRRRQQRVQSAQARPVSHNDDWSNPDYQSPYAISKEQKQELARKQKEKEKKQKKEAELSHKEEENKRRQNDDAFEAWLRKKRDEEAQQRDQDSQAENGSQVSAIGIDM